MKSYIALAFVFLAGGAIASASVACVAVNDVTTFNAAGGCVAGSFLFNNFQVANASSIPYTASVKLTGVFTPAVYSTFLSFDPQLGSSLDITDIHLEFTVTNVNGGLGPDFAELSVTGTGAGSHVKERICTDPISDINAGICNTQVFDHSVFPGGDFSSSFGAAPTLYVWKDIAADVNGNVQFTEGFAAPEPLSMALAGIGLAALGLLRRRKRS